MRKLGAIIVTLAMLMGLAVPAVAAEPVANAATQAGIGVILNGEQMAFPDAVPVLKDGRTMVPLRALIEALGGEIEYQDGLIVSKVGDTELKFTLGGDTVTAVTGDKTETVTMDVPSYYKDGRTYVPVRFFTQVLGYDVSWDGGTQSAVLVDRQALIDEIDKNFTVLNGALAKALSDPAQNYEVSGTYDISLNVADMGSGPIDVKLEMEVEMVSSATAVEMSGSIDASSLAEFLDLEDAVDTGVRTAGEAAALRKALSNITFEMLFDMEDWTFYMNIPLLEMISGGTITAGTWLKLDYNDLADMDSLMEMTEDLQENYTVGGIIYMYCQMLTDETYLLAPGEVYSAAQSASALLTAFVGDASAKKSGSNYKFHFGKTELKDLCNLIAEQTGETFTAADWAEVTAVLKVFTFDLTVKGDGTMVCDFDVQIEDAGETIGLTGSMTTSSTKGAMSMILELGSLGKMEYIIDLVMKPTDQVPQTKPPVGAVIVDLGEQLAPRPEPGVA